jgi:hypothetical protein
MKRDKMNNNRHINTILNIHNKTKEPLEKIYALYENISKKYFKEDYKKDPNTHFKRLEDNIFLTQAHERALTTIKRFYQIKFFKENKYSIKL